MTRKDYIKFAALFAGELAQARLQDSYAASLAAKRGARHASLVRGIILSTGDIFAQDNGRFQRSIFYVASGLNADGTL
jgi:hypothetical protein